MATARKPTKVGEISEPCLESDAALARAFEFLGKRWNAIILGMLGNGPTTFTELSRAIGRISDSMLAGRLAELTQAGLIERAVDEGPPVSVSYSLTDSAVALLPALGQIAVWAHDNLPPPGPSR